MNQLCRTGRRNTQSQNRGGGLSSYPLVVNGFQKVVESAFDGELLVISISREPIPELFFDPDTAHLVAGLIFVLAEGSPDSIYYATF